MVGTTGDDGYTAPDEGEGDGVFQVVWMAGFENTHPAQGVRDDLWARALVVDQGDTRIGVVVLDLVGFFYGEVQQIRDEGAQLGVLEIANYLCPGNIVLSRTNAACEKAVELTDDQKVVESRLRFLRTFTV